MQSLAFQKDFCKMGDPSGPRLECGVTPVWSDPYLDRDPRLDRKPEGLIFWIEFEQSGILIAMPTVLRLGSYRFFFYANENGEPHHIHVQRERMLAKFWLKPVALASSSGFPAQELNKLLGMVEANQQTFVEAWNGFFSSQS